MDYILLAQKIYTVVGGKSNINQAGNCMTRLRLYLKNDTPAIQEQLAQLKGVIGINPNGDELQIILGPGKAAKVAQAFQAIMAQDSMDSADAAPITEASTTSSTSAAAAVKPTSYTIGDGKQLHADIKAKNATPIKLFFKKIGSIFIPMIPGFIACGLITGILQFLLRFDASIAASTHFKLLAVMGNSIFFGLNLFVGINSAKEFGGTPILGGMLAAVICHPSLKDVVLWDENLLPGRGGIIAALVIAAIGAWLEQRIRKAIPAMLDLLLTPLLVLLLVGFAAILVIQPICGQLAAGISSTVTWAIASGGALTGFILAGCFLPMVMLGIHQGLTPIHIQLIQEYGVTLLLPILAMAGCGQVGACAAVYLKTKNKYLKKTIANALPIGMLGIGEPLIYGVTLPLGKPFITACCGAAFGGAVQAFAMTGASAIGVSGLLLTPIVNNIPLYLMGVVTAYIAGFVITWLVGFDDPPEKEA